MSSTIKSEAKYGHRTSLFSALENQTKLQKVGTGRAQTPTKVEKYMKNSVARLAAKCKTTQFMPSALSYLNIWEWIRTKKYLNYQNWLYFLKEG